MNHSDTKEPDVAFSSMGPSPAAAVAALSDLGLSDTEIARYFHVGADRIARLRRQSHGAALTDRGREGVFAPIWAERSCGAAASAATDRDAFWLRHVGPKGA